jgi:hypothetical protein
MNTTNDKLPEKNVEVLIFDARYNRWKIAKLVDHNNAQMWVQDPKLFFGLMPERFTHWTPLPEIPNA